MGLREVINILFICNLSFWIFCYLPWKTCPCMHAVKSNPNATRNKSKATPKGERLLPLLQTFWCTFWKIRKPGNQTLRTDFLLGSTGHRGSHTISQPSNPEEKYFSNLSRTLSRLSPFECSGDQPSLMFSMSDLH